MSTFGSVVRTTTFGESHGGYVGCIVDGIPPRLPLVEADVQPQLDRRRPGQSALTRISGRISPELWALYEILGSAEDRACGLAASGVVG